MKQSWSLLAGAALTAIFASSAGLAAPAVSVSAVAGTPFETNTVSEALDGAGMAGMTVTACLVTGTCETRNWAATGGTGGAAQSTNWSLGLIGDSFGNNFVFDGSGGWGSLSINTRDGLAAFDWIAGTESSPNSALGQPFSLVALDTNAEPGSIVVQYSDVLFVGGQVYNDLYTVMTINFFNSQGAPFGFSGRMEFKADTDKTGAISAYDPGTPVPVPAPATLALVGLGLVGVAASRRRARGKA